MTYLNLRTQLPETRWLLTALEHDFDRGLWPGIVEEGVNTRSSCEGVNLVVNQRDTEAVCDNPFYCEGSLPNLKAGASQRDDGGIAVDCDV